MHRSRAMLISDVPIVRGRRCSRPHAGARAWISALGIVIVLASLACPVHAEESTKGEDGFARLSRRPADDRPPVLVAGFSVAGLPLSPGDTVATVGGRLALLAPEQQVEVGISGEWAPLSSGRLEVGARLLGDCLGQPAGCYIGLGGGLWVTPDGPRPVLVPTLGVSLPRGKTIRAGLGLRVDLDGERDDVGHLAVGMYSAGVFGEIEWGAGLGRLGPEHGPCKASTTTAEPKVALRMVEASLTAETRACSDPASPGCLMEVQATNEAARVLLKATREKLKHDRHAARKLDEPAGGSK